ncbi:MULTISPECIES: hypothetical protein [unclassified Streptomyces]|nr:hypothetical protein [Streptomyces sp. Tu 4128]
MMLGPRAALGVRQDSSAPLLALALAAGATGPAYGAAASRPAWKEPT